jgi:hypothetical protein
MQELIEFDLFIAICAIEKSVKYFLEKNLQRLS